MSHASSSTLSLDQSELFANAFARLNLRDARLTGTFLLGSLLQAVYTTCGLLGLLTSSVFTQSRTTVAAMKLCVISTLDQYQRLWNFLMGVWEISSNIKPLIPDLIEHWFQSLHDLVFVLSQPRWRSSVQQKLHSLWAQCIAEIAQRSQESSFTVMAAVLFSVLEMTIEASSRALGLASSVCDILQPTLNWALDENMVQPSTFRSTQVRRPDYEASF